MHEVLIKTEEFKNSAVGRIPKDWQIKTLEECVCPDAQITYGIVQAGPHIEDGIPYIRTGDMAGDKLKLEGLLRTSPKIALSYRRSEVKTGEIVCAIRATVGKVLEVPPELDGANLTQGTARISPNHNINNRFLLWLLRSSYAQRQFNLAVKGTTFAEITLENLRKIKVPLPSSQEEQEKISAILDTVDEAIARTSSLIIKLKQTKAGLLQGLLTRGLDEDGKLRDPQVHPEQFKDSPLGRIPSDWEVHPLKSKQNPNYPYIKTGPFGSSLKGEHWVEQGVPVITIGAIGEGEFIISELLFISEAKAKSLSTYAVKEGDLVFSRVADVGRSVVVSKAQEGWIMSSNLMRISLDQYLVEPIFAYLNIVDNNLTRQQIRQFVNSGGREIANTAILDSLQFCWASKEEQIRIIQVAKTYDTRIRAEEAYLNKFKLQKQGLMQDLLTGKVRVSTIR